MTIEESKDLTSLSLDELIRNLKFHEMIIQKHFEIVKVKGERKSLTLKAKKESSDEESLTFRSEDKEYAMAVRDFKKFFKIRGSLAYYMRVSSSNKQETPDGSKVKLVRGRAENSEGKEIARLVAVALEKDYEQKVQEPDVKILNSTIVSAGRPDIVLEIPDFDNPKGL
uniref:Rho GDP-dissociation inhibitor 1-like n=1 Tax=Tanacetum cinerariifolium TaxID=118510 RepID=A0A6L2MC78_TANCI|nr:Rho GDP-dissociation inhibitor 1-like [Tanacetum cinerariifolium]